MNNVATELATALRERRAIIADEASRRATERHMERLRTVSHRIDWLAAQLPQPTHPQLAHFLQKASYDKALEFLETSESTTRQPVAR